LGFNYTLYTLLAVVNGFMFVLIFVFKYNHL
jgi:hypothetical protein